MGDLPWEGALLHPGLVGGPREGPSPRPRGGPGEGPSPRPRGGPLEVGTVSLCHVAGLGPGRLQGEADALQSHMARLCSSLAVGLRQAGGSSQVNDVAFSPNESHCATCSDDGSVRVWCVASTELLIQFQVLSQVLSGAGGTPGAGGISGSSPGQVPAGLASCRPHGLPPALVSGWARAPPLRGS